MTCALGLFAFGCFMVGSAFFAARICAHRSKRANGFVGRDTESAARRFQVGDVLDLEIEDHVAGRK